MNDREIIDLFLKRDEQAITETKKSYKNYMFKISYNILGNKEDVEENESNVLYSIWNKIPPEEPKNFKAFIAKITRNNAIDIYRKNKAEKRMGDRYSECLEEFRDIISDDSTIDGELNLNILKDHIEIFLNKISKKDKHIFLLKYFYFESINEISKQLGISISNVKVSLYRSRENLRDYLLMEGYDL